MSVHLTRLIRQMQQAHRAQRKQPSFPKFPSREWLMAQQRLVEMQTQFGLSRLGASGKLMRRLLGPHLGGQWTSNLDTLRKWQPRLILVLQPEVDKVKQVRAACPNAIIVGRFFHDDSHYASNIAARPKEFAREIHNEIANHPVTPLLDYAQSNNETNQDWQGIQQLNIFTQEWMHLADQSEAYKCAILAFSVGNPDMPHKPGDPAGFDGRMLYWQQVLPSLNYAQANGHVLLLHAYGYPDMFHPSADWYIYRYERQVQANLKKLGITKLKYLYGEIGIDRLIVNGKGGYKVVTNDQDYVNQLLQWEKDQQGQSLLLGGAIFTAGDSGGWDTYDIFSTNVASMIATHYADHAGDYESAPTGTSEPVQTHLPSISPGTSTVEPSLPPRIIDPRATQRGVTVEDVHLLAGADFWRVKEIKWYDEQEADRLGPDHHIMLDALDEQGKRMVGIRFIVGWPTGSHEVVTEAKTGEPYSANYPMSPSRNEFAVLVNGPTLSEVVRGIGMGVDTPDGFNAGAHSTTGIVFQRVKMPAATAPTQPTPAPGTTTTMYVSVPAGIIVRDGPGTHRERVDALPFGARVEVESIEPFDFGGTQRWARVGANRWVAAWLLQLEPPAEQPTPAPQEPAPEQPVGDNWARAWPIVLKIEGGLSTDRNDKGNYRPDGTFVGTRWGISANAHPDVDIINLSKEQALEIYRRDYWLASGSDRLAWPLALVHFDAYVQNPNAAKKFLAASGGDPAKYIADRIDWYTTLDTWQHHGRGWMRRCATMLREVAA